MDDSAETREFPRRPYRERAPFLPGKVAVYGVGEFDGHPFITMESVDGEDLSSLLHRTEL